MIGECPDYQTDGPAPCRVDSESGSDNPHVSGSISYVGDSVEIVLMVDGDESTTWNYKGEALNSAHAKTDDNATRPPGPARRTVR